MTVERGVEEAVPVPVLPGFAIVVPLNELKPGTLPLTSEDGA